MNDTELIRLLEGQTTPLYVYDLSALEQRVRSLRARLPGRVGLCYAVKANTFIAGAACGLVDRLEICSPGELSVCRALGLAPERFVISGVYKTPALMADMIENGPACELYTVESPGQFDLLRGAAARAKKRISVLLRLTSGNQFGLDEAELERIIREGAGGEWLDIRGIQYFSGTQKTSLKRLGRELGYLDGLMGRLGREYSFPLRELEYGPGLPVAYFQGDEFDEDAWLGELSALLDGMEYTGRVTLELGRGIAASCGTYLTRIVDMKTNCGQNYAIVDGGMHHIVYYGQSMAMHRPPVRALTPRPQAEPESWNICGALCSVNDILVKQLPLRAPETGDVLVFENAGAYCALEGPALFLSRDLPAVMLAGRGEEPVCVRGHLSSAPLNTPNFEVG